MSHENKYTAIVLKKQPLNEADEIITFFTREQGKIRCLAKAVKMAKSKLQQRLQTLFLVNLTVASGRLPKIIGAEPVKVFANLRENLPALKRGFYALELVLKFTADEHQNERLFNSLADFLGFLDAGQTEEILSLGLAKFKMEVLESVGLGVRMPKIYEPKDKIFFSADRGGFSQTKSGDALPLLGGTYKMFLALKNGAFKNLDSVENAAQNGELQNLLSQFIEYHLERNLKSEKYLTM